MTKLITPPPELIAQWIQEWVNIHGPDNEGIDYVVAKAAQWGADQELEACCEWFADDVVSEVVSVVAELRAARRRR